MSFFLEGEELIINVKKSSGTICILGLLRKELSNTGGTTLERGRDNSPAGEVFSRTPGKPDGPVAITLGVLPLASQALRGWSRLSERLPEVRQLRDA